MIVSTTHHETQMTPEVSSKTDGMFQSRDSDSSRPIFRYERGALPSNQIGMMEKIQTSEFVNGV